MTRPKFVMLGGPNGSGKSTMAPIVVRDVWGIKRFLNADTIARGLAAYDPDLAAVSAGRAMLQECDRLTEQRQDFAIETTLSGRGWAARLKGPLKDGDYRTHLAFVYINAPGINIQRVASRVAIGGHHIPDEDVRRRHQRALNNFFRIFRPLVQSWEVYDNTGEEPRLIASQQQGQDVLATDDVEWRRLETTYG